MITPSFGLTATERVLPKLALDFTTATLDPRVTFTRSGNTATYTNSSGVITAINADLPRFDYNPTTLACQGLLIEESRKNLFLNSLINGTNLTTQIVTTTATATTISFYGTGSIVLSGTHSATVTGTGAYPSRKTYTFTPTAGALTCTVSGTVQYAQIEAGAFATSFIPTDGTVGGITRNADVATMTGTNFSDWFNASEGSFAAQYDRIGLSTTGSQGYLFNCAGSAGSGANRLAFYQRTSSQEGALVIDNNVTQFNPNAGAASVNTVCKATLGYKASNYGTALNGASPVTQASGTVPSATLMYIGSRVGASDYLNGHLQKLSYWPQRLINAEIQAFSK